MFRNQKNKLLTLKKKQLLKIFLFCSKCNFWGHISEKSYSYKAKITPTELKKKCITSNMILKKKHKMVITDFFLKGFSSFSSSLI